MSKGNLLFGQGRGKIGDLVLTRVAGEQVARSRNRNPKNPRTTKQMVQRAAMATLVEFFKRGNRNLFKFAFESKKPGESDYNAFVRANINRVPVQSKKTLRENGFVGGEYIMTEGSLPTPSYRINSQDGYCFLRVGNLTEPDDAYTVGGVSRAMELLYGLQDGDFITVVGISSRNDRYAEDIETAIAQGALIDGYLSTDWRIVQFKLDSASTAALSSLGLFDLGMYESSTGEIALLDSAVGGIAPDQDFPVMMCVIASRPTASGVLVSTSQMVQNKPCEEASTVGLSDEWKIWVAKHFMETTAIDAPAEDILKGSLSEN